MHCFRTGVEKGMKLRTAVQEGCGYKDILHAHCYYAPLAKYFTVCITYQPTYVNAVYLEISLHTDKTGSEQKHMRTKVLQDLVLTMYLILLALSKTTGFW